MKILFITQYYPPEVATGPHLALELSESLVKRGHDVTVVTCFPRYNIAEMPKKYWRRLFCREEMNGVQVVRINAPNYYGGSRLSRKLVQILVPPVLGFCARFIKRPDIVYCVTPPILNGKAGIRVARRHRVPCVVNVQDLFPQSMIDLGVIGSPLLIRLFEAWERFVYRNATAITVMSDGNRDFVIGKGTDPEKVHTAFNWVDVDEIRPMDRMNSFRKEHQIPEDHFVVGFAGTMGVSQDLPVIIEAARLLQDRKDILFLMVGDGTERGKCEKLARGLDSVRFLPMQPKETYPLILGSCDACFATLLASVKTPTVPSKIATIMSAGRPVLAALPPGDAPDMIREANAGMVCDAGDSQALADSICNLKENPQKVIQYGESGRSFVENNFSRESCIMRLERIFQDVLGKTESGHRGD